MGYDLLLRGGRVICPASGVDGDSGDVAIRDGRIAAIEPSLLPKAARGRPSTCGASWFCPGLIDMHAHVFRHVTGRFGLDADLVGVRFGRDDPRRSGRGRACMTFPAFL